jgi:hypothetical protein
MVVGSEEEGIGIAVDCPAYTPIRLDAWVVSCIASVPAPYPLSSPMLITCYMYCPRRLISTLRLSRHEDERQRRDKCYLATRCSLLRDITLPNDIDIAHPVPALR